jgi:hypothetical protein
LYWFRWATERKGMTHCEEIKCAWRESERKACEAGLKEVGGTRMMGWKGRGLEEAKRGKLQQNS